MPVISQLAAKLDEYRALCGSPETGLDITERREESGMSG